MHESIKVVIGIHRGYLMAKSIGMPPLFGKEHYYYYSEKGSYSLVWFPDMFGNGMTWEICELDKEHEPINTDKIERFKSKEDAEKRIEKLLKVET